MPRALQPTCERPVTQPHSSARPTSNHCSIHFCASPKTAWAIIVSLVKTQMTRTVGLTIWSLPLMVLQAHCITRNGYATIIQNQFLVITECSTMNCKSTPRVVAIPKRHKYMSIRFPPSGITPNGWLNERLHGSSRCLQIATGFVG